MACRVQNKTVSEVKSDMALKKLGLIVKNKKDMTQDDYITNFHKLRNGLGVTEVSIDKISDEVKKLLQLPKDRKLKRVYVFKKTGEIAYQLSNTDRVEIAKLRHTSREALEELFAGSQSELKSSIGARNHAVIQYITENIVNSDTSGLLHKNTEIEYGATILGLDEIKTFSTLDVKQFQHVKDGVDDMLKWIKDAQRKIDPKGKAKILTEQVVAHPEEGWAGTADLIILFSDGSYGQVDFKTMYPELDLWGTNASGEYTITDPNWIYTSKKEDFDMQLMNNNRALEEVLGLGKRRFSRVIPIAVNLYYDKKKGGNIDKIKNIKMGMSTKPMQKLMGDPMLPLALGEKTNIQKLDDQLTKLMNIKQNKSLALQKMHPSNPKYSIARKQLEDLDRTINKIIIDKDMNHLVHEVKKIASIYYEKFYGLKDIDTEIIGGKINPAYLSTGEIAELRHIISAYQSIIATSGNYMVELGYNPEKTTNYESFTKTMDELVSVLSMMDLALREKMVERVMDDEFDMGRLADSIDPSMMQVWFREASEHHHVVLQKLATEVAKANDKRRLALQGMERRLRNNQMVLEKWAVRNGLSLQEAYNKIITDDTVNFIRQYNSQFWKDMKKAMKEQNNEWLNKHLKLKEGADESYRINRENFIAKGYSKEEIERWEKNYSVKNSKYNMRRWGMYYDINESLPSTYYTNEYTELLKPGNEELKHFYHDSIAVMQDAKRLLGVGAREGIPYNALPNIRADLLAQLLDYGMDLSAVKEAVSSVFTTRPDDAMFGNTMINTKRRVNPVTGEFLPEVPILYMNPLRDKHGNIDNTLKSRDITKSLYLFYDMALNYKFMTEEVEPKVEAWRDLLIIEGNKTLTESGATILSPTEEQHRVGGAKTRVLKLYDNLVDYHVYGIRIPDAQDKKKLTKQLMGLKSWHAKKELSFAPVAQMGNFMQVRAGAYFTGLSGYHYTFKQLRKVSNMRMRKDELYKAIVQFVEPSPNRSSIIAKNLGSRKVGKIVNWDTAFWGFRKGEETVNDDALVAIMMNYGFDKNGNIRRLKMLPKGTKSLFENSTIEDGRLIIDGIIDKEGKVNYDKYTALRRLAKGVGTDIKGQPDSQNPHGINLQLWGNLMMQYKGWMPGMVAARLGAMYYSPDRQAIVEGKVVSLLNDLKNDTEKSLAGFIFTEALPRLLQFTAMMPLIMVSGKGYTINETRAKAQFIKYKEKFANDPVVQELSFEDFMDYRQGQIRSLAAELTTILSLLAMIWAMSASWRDDDDPLFAESYAVRTLFRLTHRAKREIAFMFDVDSWQNTILKTPIPILGYITDLTKFLSATLDQIGDDITGKDIEREGLYGVLFGKNIGGSARDKKGRFYESGRWSPLNKGFKFIEVHTAHRETIY